jgi:hypothetical protein
MWVSVKGFLNKLDVFHHDVMNNKDHFPTLKSYLDTLDNPDTVTTAAAASFITQLITEFNSRFQACKNISGIIDMIIAPTMSNSNSWKQQLSWFKPTMRASDVVLELCEFMADTASTKELAEKGIVFCSWPVVRQKYVLLSQIGMGLLVMFGSSYACESLFSKLAFIKNKYRSQITDEHIKQLLVLASSENAPDFMGMIAKKQCQTSH